MRFFAALRELATDRVDVEVGDEPRLIDVWRACVERYPALEPHTEFVRGARNAAYAHWRAEVHPGDEIAFLPPVSGGAAPVEVSDAPIEMERLTRIAGLDHGAVVTFIGRARNTADDGRGVVELEYEAYTEMATAVLTAIVAEAQQRWPGTSVAVVHRTGTVPLGEAAVAIVAAAPHRSEAYDANRYVIEQIKQRLPIWKRERYADGSEWKRPGA